MWQPLSVERVGSTLIVVAKERQVTQTVYEAMILIGLCGHVDAGRIALEGITEIAILNRFGGQGWVFEGGAVACGDIMAAPRDGRRIRLLGQSRLY